MLTAKRIYLYGVLLVSLTLMLWGLTDLVRFALDGIAQAIGSTRPIYGGSFAGEELSRALALGLVAGTIFVVHLALVRRTLGASRAEVTEEHASPSRATYFFLVLVGTGFVLFWSLVDLVSSLLGTVAFGERGQAIVEPLGSVIVIGTAWLLHLVARGRDLRADPERTAGDWLTRAYLYGALFATFLVGAVQAGELLTALARQVLDIEPAFESFRWWEEAITGSVGGVTVAVAAWLTHWALAERLLDSPDPLGIEHRTARTRRGYFLVVVFASALAVLVLGAMSLQHVLAELSGTWRSSEGSRLVEDIGGPLLMLLPFLPAWWWHLRRGSREAFAAGGAEAGRAVTRTGRLVVAFVGLAGLAVGLAWQLQVLIEAIGSTDEGGALFTSLSMVDSGASALATALVGLLLWTPAWALSQRERTAHVVEAATAGSRRAYLMLASGLSVVAAMGALAYLVWQTTRVLLDTGSADDASWAVGVLVVSSVVLMYHLWQLRADLRVAHAVTPAAPETRADRVVEIIEISAPADADFKVLNAAIRTELPDGFEMHVTS